MQLPSGGGGPSQDELCTYLCLQQPDPGLHGSLCQRRPGALWKGQEVAVSWCSQGLSSNKPVGTQELCYVT